jgi:bifunctional non-homologous end joining protein LigD
MPLEAYRAKRDFRVTPEPPNRARKRAARGRPKRFAGGEFVVQLHAARALHCDFRLEWPDGVLKSWAVPKGPSLDPALKRLAVHVEDHPFDYRTFEGVIPAGQYGAGKVIVWDRGRWMPEGDPIAAYARGELKFTLEGARLHGGFALIRTRRTDRGKDQWLLIKERDAHAQRGAAFDFGDRSRSVVSGRALAEVGTEAAPAGGGTPRVKLPASLECQLATAVEAAPTGAGWWFETKFDGYRMLARVDARGTRLFSRSGRDWTERFPRIVAELGRLALGPSWLDGEIVVLDEHGLSRFQRLQNALDAGEDAALRYFVFDAPYLNGTDLRARPLRERKALLERALARAGDGPVRLSQHLDLDAATAQRDACEMGFEGLIAKRVDAPYRAARTRDWLKLKCRKRQEFVVVGYTEPAGSRTHFGALLLAYAEKRAAWRFAGRVGTGFDRARLSRLAGRLRALEVEAPALAVPRQPGRVHWVKPELVVEVEFAEWTDDGLVRQASFVGVREDKPARAVGRERSVAPPRAARLAAARTHAARIAQPALPADARITHPERIVFPKDGRLSTGVTKVALAEYYARIAPVLLPHLVSRPLSIVRAPDGLEGERFFQKHAHGHFPKAVGALRIVDAHGATQEHLCVRDLAGLLGLVQMGTVELHGWGSRAKTIERPDRLAFDLDPDEGLPWARVVEAAQLARTTLDALGLATLPMTTGGKGLHLVAHVAPKADWAAIEAFAKGVAEYLARTLPSAFTANMSKAKRRGKIFLDYLRNQRSATAVMPYSVRLKPGATVATPISWAELARGVDPGRFDVETVPERVRRGRDAWGTIQPQPFDLRAARARLARLLEDARAVRR